jgi:hypothetical protein
MVMILRPMRMGTVRRFAAQLIWYLFEGFNNHREEKSHPEVKNDPIYSSQPPERQGHPFLEKQSKRPLVA